MTTGQPTSSAAIDAVIYVAGSVALFAIPVVLFGPLWLGVILAAVGTVGMVGCAVYVTSQLIRPKGRRRG